MTEEVSSGLTETPQNMKEGSCHLTGTLYIQHVKNCRSYELVLRLDQKKSKPSN
jgi:hypothetical protein